jgi:hypothetical protein
MCCAQHSKFIDNQGTLVSAILLACLQGAQVPKRDVDCKLVVGVAKACQARDCRTSKATDGNSDSGDALDVNCMLRLRSDADVDLRELQHLAM